MNEGISKLIRADMKALKVTIPENRGGRRKIPRAAKRFWAALSHKKRGKLSKTWHRVADPNEKRAPTTLEEIREQMRAMGITVEADVLAEANDPERLKAVTE